MKKFFLLLAITTAFSAHAQVKLLICEGKIADQDITILDDGYQVGVHKGKLDIAAGPSGNNFPSAVFDREEIHYTERSENCQMILSSTEKGSLTLTAPCSGNGAGTLSTVSLPTLQLTTNSANVTCRLEDYSRPQRQNQRQPQRPERNERTDECRNPPGSSHTPGYPQRTGSRYAPQCNDEE